MRLSDALVAMGSHLMRERFQQPVNHWRKRIWDGDRAEAHGTLGGAYRAEREAIEMLIASAAPGRCVLDVGAGTGRYTLSAANAGARHVTALDISTAALQELGRRARLAGHATKIRLLVGDFWTASSQCWCGERYGVVMSMDAIHHLGQLPQVLARLDDLSDGAGTVLGDIWTQDNFGDFQRKRRGEFEHMLATLRFLAGAILISLAIRPTSNAVRSDLRLSDDASQCVSVVWPGAYVDRSKYWVRFAARLSQGAGAS